MSDAPDLVLIPNTADVITNGPQYIARSLLAPFQAAAAEFRAEAGRPVYVAEAYRSDTEQRRIFLERYYRVDYPTSVLYEGSYWVKRTGVATAAVPGSIYARHRLGEALDLWSGIDTSFLSPNHLIWVRVAKKHGWDNTGRGFGEPWHQQGTPVTSPAPAPIPESQEDDDMTEDDRKILKQAAADAKAARDHADTAKQAVARLEAATIGTGKYTIVNNLETIKKSQARVEVLANTISNGVGKRIAKLKA
ncbi:hypothetical protein [Frigoribacterium faeni]|uniref:Peptidase M15B domain-containing protein n=1 Tax=Frigoribacterium faeni TaxID=145483 RepID=A0A7W3JH14_9MICO|nr:hypothetical protein [Frigoribacterium faeni]MBA8812658.1 hypothetical protein [Frigoribacterium faeni]BFF13768.1 hypothetical protein GCM10025699_50710 [Microbacterium flavescens]GEK82329.1 hypothetical protein FFA01_06380 [Frigoribacterium faeni]